MTFHSRFARAALGAAAAAAFAGLVAVPAASAEEVLTAVHAFPKNIVYSESFLEYVDKVNEAGKGVVRIDVRGGPEAIAMFEQPQAVQRGVVDMVYSPGSFYASDFPEKDALVASNSNGPEARASGAIDLLDQAHQKAMNVKWLGWMDSGIPFYIYMVPEPKVDASGKPDLSEVKMRGNPIYNGFLENYLGATVATIPSTDVYSGLERGTINATPWTSIGVMDWNWDKFFKYRIDQPFFSTDLGIMVNLDKWNSLSPEAQKILQDVAIEHEKSSYEKLQQQSRDELAEQEKRGIQPYKLDPEAARAFVNAAKDEVLARMKDGMEKKGRGENFEILVEAFKAGKT